MYCHAWLSAAFIRVARIGVSRGSHEVNSEANLHTCFVLSCLTKGIFLCIIIALGQNAQGSSYKPSVLGSTGQLASLNSNSKSLAEV